jgi:putative flippase GtrA
LLLYQAGVQETTAALSAFWIAAAVNYLLCILLLFRHQARWNTQLELFFYLLVVSVNSLIDTTILTSLMRTGFSPISAKLSATAVSLVFNFLGRRFIVFPEASSGPWKPQHVFNGETEDDEPQDAAAVSVEES